MTWLPRRGSRTGSRISFTLFGVLLIYLGFNQFTDNSFDALLLLSTGGLLFIIGSVYLAEWFENLTYSVRIIQAIVFTTLFAGIVGFFVFGAWKSFATALFGGFAATIVGTVCAFGFYINEKREEHSDSLPQSKAGKKRMVRN